MRDRGEHDVLQSVRLAQRFGVLGFRHESHAVDGERRVVRDRVEESPLRRVELDDHAVGDGQNADDAPLDGERKENLLNPRVLRGAPEPSPTELPDAPRRPTRTDLLERSQQHRSSIGVSRSLHRRRRIHVRGPTR